MKEEITFEQLSENLKVWATERNILQKENGFKQLLKLSEEKGELCSAYLKGDSEGTIDGIGDCFVVLTIFCHQNGLDPIKCLESAYNEIKNRKGKTENGVFIKNEPGVLRNFEDNIQGTLNDLVLRGTCNNTNSCVTTNFPEITK